MFGQLGDGSTTNRSTPVQVKNVNGTGFLSNIAKISAGASHSMFLGSNGSVYACGYNSVGQLGDGTTTDRSTPVQVKNVVGQTGFLSNIVSISAESNNSLFLASNGSLYATGYSGFGALGNGNTTDNSSTPVVVSTSVTNIKRLNDIAPPPPPSKKRKLTAAERHALVESHKKAVAMAGKPFEVVAVNLAEPPSRIEKFLEKTPLSFTLLLDRDTKTAKAWQAKILPASYLIGRDGRIRYQVLGELDWAGEHARDLDAEFLGSAFVVDRTRCGAGPCRTGRRCRPESRRNCPLLAL